MKNPRRRDNRTACSSNGSSRVQLGRLLRAEALEQRQMMAGDVAVSPHHNSWHALDVNNDLRVTPMDALVVLNDLNRAGIRDLDGETVQESKFVDVNGDRKVSALDALQVINALNRGEGQDVPVVEMILGLTDDNGVSVLNPGTRTADLSVGQVVNLEVLYTDARRFGNGLGLFTVYTDILTSQAGILEPLVTETQILSLTENFVDSTGGSVTLTQEGSAVVSLISFDEIAASPTNAIRQALIDDFGYEPEQIFTSLETREPRGPGNPVGDPFDIFVRFLGDEFVDVDVPNLSIDASGLTTSTQQPVVGSADQIDPRLADGSINPIAVGFSLDTRSRTGEGANVYTNVRQGSFNDDPTDQIQDGFSSIGATGQLNAGGLPSILGSVTYRPEIPFEAFSIRVRVTEAVENLELQIQIPLEEQTNPNDPEETVLVIYGNRQDGTSGDERGLSPVEVVVDDDGMIVINVTEDVTARADPLTTNEDSGQTINPLANDSNQGAGTLSVVATTNGSNGTVTFTADSVTYTPSQDFFGTDSFTYTARNGDGKEATGTVNVTVNPVNDAPTAQNFTITVTEGATREILNSEFISRSTTGPANENQTATLTTISDAASQGDATLNGDGSVTYVAPSAFQGTDTFTYTISDGIDSVTATVTINVVDQNDPPVAADDTLSIVEDTAVTYTAEQFRANVLANDTPGPQNEIDNGQIVSLVPGNLTGSAGGTLVQNADGTVTYTPPANVFGNAAETIVYTVTDGELTDTATITINIQGVNDAPIAVNDPDLIADELTPDQTIDVLANDSAGPLEDQTQTISIARIVTGPTNGTATISANGLQIIYSPADDFTGTDTLTYVIVDSEGLESTVATATIEVVPVIRPRAKNDSFTVAEDSGASTFNIIGNDLANEGATVVLDTVGTIPAAQGTLTRVGEQVQFTPAADFFGSVTFTYTITDTSNPVIDTEEEIASATGRVTITVTSVNDAPVFVADTAVAATEDTLAAINASTLLANDSVGPANESSQTLSVSAVSPTSTNGGTVELDGQTINYSPRTDFNGTDTFTYTILDSEGATVQGTVTLTVAAVNDAPVLNLAANLTASEDVTSTFSQAAVLGSSLPGPATATDETSQTLSITSVGTNGSTEFGGTVSLVGGQVQYRAATNYNGPDSFTVTVSDSAGATSIGTVTLSVTPVNDPPVVGDPTLLAFNKSTVIFTQADLLAASTAGPPNETGTLSVTAATQVASTTGTITFDPTTGAVSYRAADGFVGTDSFSITISDGELTTTGTITVDVREFEPSTVRGTVFFDFAESISNPVRNGIQDDNEPGLEMAHVRLISGAADNVTGNAIETELMTDANGDFEFTNVPPGTYQLRMDLPIMAIDGTDIVGTRGDSDSVLNQFTFVIDEPGGFVAEDYRFTLFGLTGRAGNALDLLVSNYLASNPDVAEASNNGADGAKAILDSTGMQQWFIPKSGFEDFRFGEINISDDHSVVTLTLVNFTGGIFTGVIPENRRVVLEDPNGSIVVQIFGNANNLGLQPDGSINDGDLGLLRYQDAVDMLMEQDNSVI